LQSWLRHFSSVLSTISKEAQTQQAAVPRFLSAALIYFIYIFVSELVNFFSEHNMHAEKY
jgi:hypothetical protein